MAANELYDLAIVGSGPAGLSASFTAGSEGLSAIVLEARDRYGGQARQSTLIENFGGFPEGVIGEDLMARFVLMSTKFGVTLKGLTRVVDVEKPADAAEPMKVIDDEGLEFSARAVLLSPGVQYRRLQGTNVDDFLDMGVSYGSPTVRDSYTNKKLMIVGGGNNAGQAASYLANNCDGCEVHLLVRGPSISKSMSPYLVTRLEAMKNVTIHTETEVARVDGNGRLEEATLRSKRDGTQTVVPADELFLLIGANPKTNWLRGKIELDKHGFIPTGGALSEEARAEFAEAYGRQPQAYETSVPGLFAVGDIRSGSTKRVASAHGQGAVVIGQIKEYIDHLALTQQPAEPVAASR